MLSAPFKSMLLLLALLCNVKGFSTPFWEEIQAKSSIINNLQQLLLVSNNNNAMVEHVEEKESFVVVSSRCRRSMIFSSFTFSSYFWGSMIDHDANAAEPPPPLSTVGAGGVLPLIQEAREQLEPIPNLIKGEKWDSVRAILITPPLSDCWSKTSKLLQRYADEIGENPSGDELAALEYKEEALDHLRFLDMAAYNNVFNPIKTEGETGATKELIRSYYEDPINEYNACIQIFDGLLNLSK